MSRPRWEVNGSTIAPAAALALSERVVLAPAPHASHAWFADEAASAGRLRLAFAPRSSQRLAARGPGAQALATPVSLAAPPPRSRLSGAEADTPVTMSISAPGAAASDGSGRVTMRMEVPVPGAAAASGEVIGARTGSSQSMGVEPAAPIQGTASEKTRAAREASARQEQFNRASAVKAEKERLLLAETLGELDRAQQRTDRAKSGLSESVRDLDQFRSVLQTAFLEAGPDATGLNPFVRAAQRYAGTPYVWGGESRSGFDCSGFIIVVMRDLGYRALPHSAAEQFNYGLPVAKALLKPGDLVFFQNTYKPGISHVGIYLGRGRFIQAAGTGKGTIVSYLAASPYAQKYAGARRLFRSN